MPMPLLLFALSLAGQSAHSIECANLIDSTSEFRSNPDGLRMAVRVRAADDHNKDSHLCQTDYSLVIMPADGASTEREIESFDDSWGRSLTFRAEGFVRHGRRFIATIAEGGDSPVFQIVVYSLDSEQAETYQIPRHFVEQVRPRCRPALRIVGLTRQDLPVVGFETGTCPGATAMWKLMRRPALGSSQRPSRLIRVSDPSVVDPIWNGESGSLP